MKKRFFLLCMTFIIFSFQLTHAATSKSERVLLQKIAKQTFNYFWDAANPENGLIRDATTNQNASISVVGFGLAGLCIAAENKWITRDAAYQRALTTLRSFSPTEINNHKTRVASENGHPYHWVSTFDGSWPNVEGIFSTDTAVFIAGVLTVGSYFKGTEVEKLANAIYKKVDWTWFYNAKEDSLYLGWTPQGGHFGKYQMNEIGILPTLLAISSPTHSINASSWFTLGQRYYQAAYKDYEYYGDATAFTHQWPFCFINPKLKKDFFLDYAQNNREFALASRDYCIDHRGEGYGPNLWGMNVALGPEKYGNYGAPVIDNAPLYYNGQDNDGTIAPTAAIGFLPFTPEKSMAFINNIYSKYSEKIFKKYGFTDSFNLSVDFFSDDHLGINQGPILIMIDNYLNGTVWKYFSTNSFIKKGLDTVGYVGLIDNFDNKKHSSPYCHWTTKSSDVTIDFNDTLYKEGQKSMAIHYPRGKNSLTLSGVPQRQSLENYRYLALWQSGADTVTVKLMTNKKQAVKLTQIKKVNNGDWNLVYYQLPKKSSQILSGLSLTIIPNPAMDATYIDYIHLSNNLFVTAAGTPTHVEAIPGKHSGEVLLSWQTIASKTAHSSYQIKYSKKPFSSKTIFDRENKNVVTYHDVMRPGQYQTSITGLPVGEKYYFSICSVNPVGYTSKIVSANTEIPGKETILFDFDPKELTMQKLSGWEIFHSTGDSLEVIYIPAKLGHAMELNYISDQSGQAWFGIKKKIEGRMKKNHLFKLNYKGSGINTHVEFKLITSSGAVFGKKIENIPFDNNWHELTVSARELAYWWGGDGNMALDYVDSIELVFTTEAPGRGRIAINHLRSQWK